LTIEKPIINRQLSIKYYGFVMNFFIKILEIFTKSGYGAMSWGHVGMLIIGAILLYLAIVKKFEPLLLLPIAFGAILVNLPLSGIIFILARGTKCFPS
jgi:Na+-transporting methylmalonyl-CoA/oxaloacetate decarboxylase beta subunit